jgi:hypothetical protein
MRQCQKSPIAWQKRPTNTSTPGNARQKASGALLDHFNVVVVVEEGDALGRFQPPFFLQELHRRAFARLAREKIVPETNEEYRIQNIEYNR